MPYIHDEEVDEYLAECVTIDENNIEAEYTRVSGDLFYWSRRLSQKDEEFALVKAQLKQAESRAMLEIRTRGLEEGSKYSIPILEAKTAVHPSVVAANAEYAAVYGQREELKGVVAAISTKREMLISLGATRRQELKSIPGIT